MIMENEVMPDFRLRSFLAAVRAGGISAAAREIGLTQPAVSQQIDALEELYGAVLLERRGRGVAPTAAGLALYAAGERIEALYREAARSVAEAAGRPRYEIGATLTIAEYLVPAAFAELRRELPGAEIGLRAANTAEVVRAVRRGELALGLVEGPFDRAGLEAEAVGVDRLVAVTAPGALPGPATAFPPPACAGPLPLADFLALPLIARERGSGTRAVFEAWLAGRGVDAASLAPAMEIGSIGTVKALVERGMGVAVLSELAVARELAEGRLALLEVEGLPAPREFFMVRLPGAAAGFAARFARVVRGLAGRARKLA